MENVAHALAGLLLAEGAIQLRARTGPAPSPRFARLAYVASALASNVPDGDVAYASITSGKLGYLLHHRGHTHTLPVAIALGLLIAAAVALWGRRRGAPIDAGEVRWLLGLGALGSIGHIGMDAWNVYGVHPFWPLYDGWLYGDAVFIVEPLLWIAAVPPLFFAARSRAWRAALGLVLAAGVALPWLAPQLVTLPFRVALLAAAPLGLAAARRAGPGARAAGGLAAFAGVALVFFVAGRFARAAIERRLEAEGGGARTHDVALTGLPANPLCWSGVTIQTTAAGEIVSRRVTAAPLPALVPVDRCPAAAERITAPLVARAASSDRGVRWDGELRAPVARLRELGAGHCEVAAMMRFVRAPFWLEGPAGLVVGDLRFDRDEALGFAEIEVAAIPARCPRFVPPWIPPRRDVLAPSANGAIGASDATGSTGRGAGRRVASGDE